MKGIVLAGGLGTRLLPMTLITSKHLLPVYDKPMIYYPLSILFDAGIKEILIICKSNDIDQFKKIIGNKNIKYGATLSYLPQDDPKGIAEAFAIGKEFINNDSVCVILGDNIFFDDSISESIRKFDGNPTIFTSYVNNPEKFGVAYFDNRGKLVDIIEKPKDNKSSHAITGLYLYSSDVVDVSKTIEPSKRGELEISDINRYYLTHKRLNVIKIDGEWIDAGEVDSLLIASNKVKKYKDEFKKKYGNI